MEEQSVFSQDLDYELINYSWNGSQIMALALFMAWYLLSTKPRTKPMMIYLQLYSKKRTLMQKLKLKIFVQRNGFLIMAAMLWSRGVEWCLDL